MTTRNANIEAAADQWTTAMTTAADARETLIATMLREVQAGRITKTAACELAGVARTTLDHWQRTY